MTSRTHVEVYICGLKAMVDDVRERLKANGFDRKQIVFEKYHQRRRYLVCGLGAAPHALDSTAAASGGLPVGRDKVFLQRDLSREFVPTHFYASGKKTGQCSE